MSRYYGIYGADNVYIPLHMVRFDVAQFIDRANGTPYDPNLPEWTIAEHQFIDMFDEALLFAAETNTTMDALILEYSNSTDSDDKQLAAFFAQLKAERGAVSVFGYWA